MLERVDLRPYTTLKVGGAADRFGIARSADQLLEFAAYAHREGLPLHVLGWGSNVCPSDAGVPGLVVLNLARRIEFSPDGWVRAESGCGFQELFLQAAQRGWGGLEFAVGIPGTLGGALVSNAGAYRSNISEFVRLLDLAEAGEWKRVEAEWMGFRYRDSRLRQSDPPEAVLLKVHLQLPARRPKEIYDEARDYQRQRISKQPPSASAGSFFKNVVDAELAESIEGLTPGMRKAGVVPAGFLIEAVGLKGTRKGGAMLGARHANFMLNVGGATASEIRALAELAKARVFARFGVRLEEEVLYLGRW